MHPIALLAWESSFLECFADTCGLSTIDEASTLYLHTRQQHGALEFVDHIKRLDVRKSEQLNRQPAYLFGNIANQIRPATQC